MRHTLLNSDIEFVFDTLGAEPCALRFRDDVDYFGKWRSPETYRATVCFPLLGKVPGGRYFYDGLEYEMGQHGFAKDMDFVIVDRAANSAVLELRDSEQTRRIYPFEFRFQVKYTLDGATLRTEYHITNTGGANLLYSVGAHPFFSCPLDDAEGASFSDYFLEFDVTEGANAISRSFGPVDALVAAFSADGRRLNLSDALFDDGAFCLSAPPSQRVRLHSGDGGRYVEMDLGSAPYLQVWSRQGESFVCLEPWYGAITSNPPEPSDHVWAERRGTMIVPSGASESHGFAITPHRS